MTGASKAEDPAPRRFTVPEESKGARLQDFLETQLPRVDRRFLRRLLDDGDVEVNFELANGRRKVLPGDIVDLQLDEATVELPEYRGKREVADDEALAVLAEADFCLVVDKPAGIPTQADRAGRSIGVHGRVLAQFPGSELRVVHRLDQGTSGCLAFAKTLEGARHLDTAFRERAVAKSYLALVEGRVARDEFAVTKSLGPDRKRPGKVVVSRPGTKGARDAHTDFEVVERFRSHTLVRARPRTGRGHQIRVHLRAVGHPIVGDVDYGASGPLLLSTIKPGYKSRKGTVERPLLDRMFLHSDRLVLPKPGEAGGELQAESALPESLQRALDKLRRFAALREPGAHRESPDAGSAH